MNATRFTMPEGNIIFYMFRPFIGNTLSQVLDNISKYKKESQCRVLIAHTALSPEEESNFLSKGCFEKRKEYLTILLEHSWCLWECK